MGGGQYNPSRLRSGPILVIGLPLAIWIAPSGLLATPPGSWSMEQIYRGAAAFVLFFWTLIFAANVRD